MTVWIKQGVCGDLTIPARKCLGRIAKLYISKGHDFYLTSVREANHSYGSLHYNGNAFDFRKEEDISLIEIKEAAGPRFDVVDESNHIHCEYDPK